MTTYSFAEPAHQTGTRWQIRVVGDEGRKPNGGIPAGRSALCGLDLERGWDVTAEITPSSVEGLLERNRDMPTICVGCAEIYLREVSA